MILDIQNVSKSYLSETVIENISFHIEEGQKCALIGMNGSGKTTLLRLIVSELTPDEGNIYLSSGAKIGYLPQIHNVESDLTLYDYLKDAKKDVFELENKIRQLEQDMKAASGDELNKLMESYASLSQKYERMNGFAALSEINGVIKGLGFTEKECSQVVSSMSGGEKTRAALGRLLLSDYDILLLDEPTNHLDLKSVEWLEGYINGFKGAVLIVSHDRYFLDRIVTKVVEIENKHMLSFDGNYTAYSEKKEQMRKAEMKAYLNQQSIIKHQEEVIEKLKRFNREKSIKRAESREKALSKIERLEKPIELRSDMRLKLNPAVLSGNDVLEIKNLKKSYGGRVLFENADINIYRGEKVALLGDNGTGKTTLLRILNENETSDDGLFKYGSNVFHAYYDQEHQVLNPENNIFEEILDDYPDMTNTEIRNLLAGFLFTGDDIFKLVKNLSGGEKARLSLAKLMLSQSNFLILDEPTNHLDIISREILEDAINSYSGTVFYVSHDRYFINKTATRILELENKCFTEYKGNYDYYIEKKAEKAAALQENKEVLKSTQSQANVDWKEYKKEQARIRKLENDLKKTEDGITKLEEEIKEIDRKIALPENATSSTKLTALCSKKAELEEKLEELYESWEILSEEVSSLE